MNNQPQDKLEGPAKVITKKGDSMGIELFGIDLSIGLLFRNSGQKLCDELNFALSHILSENAHLKKELMAIRINHTDNVERRYFLAEENAALRKIKDMAETVICHPCFLDGGDYQSKGLPMGLVPRALDLQHAIETYDALSQKEMKE